MTKPDLAERVLLAMGPQLAEQPPEDLVSQAHSIADRLIEYADKARPYTDADALATSAASLRNYPAATVAGMGAREYAAAITGTGSREYAAIQRLRRSNDELHKRLVEERNFTKKRIDELTRANDKLRSALAEMTKNRDDAGMQCLDAEAQLRNLREISDAQKERIEEQTKTIQRQREEHRGALEKKAKFAEVQAVHVKLLQEQVDNQATRLHRVRQKVCRLRTQGDHLPTWARNLLQDADALLGGHEPPELTLCRLSHAIDRLQQGLTDDRHFEDVVKEAIEELREVLG